MCIRDSPSYPLRDYRLSWEIYDDTKLLSRGERRLADLSSTQTVSGQVGGNAQTHKLQLHLALVRPTGEIASEKTLDWNTSGPQARRTIDRTFPVQ